MIFPTGTRASTTFSITSFTVYPSLSLPACFHAAACIAPSFPIVCIRYLHSMTPAVIFALRGYTTAGKMADAFSAALHRLWIESEELESHAYELIHTTVPEEIFKMKFDVIVGNPPYQLNVGVEKENYAIAIYDKFVDQAKKLKCSVLINDHSCTLVCGRAWP